MAKTLIGQATADQLVKWKEEHGALFAYEVEDRVAYLKSVDRNVYALAASKIRDAGPAKFNEVVVENIWVGGDETIRQDDRYYFGLIDFVEELMAKKKGILRSL